MNKQPYYHAIEYDADGNGCPCAAVIALAFERIVPRRFRATIEVGGGEILFTAAEDLCEAAKLLMVELGMESHVVSIYSEAGDPADLM